MQTGPEKHKSGSHFLELMDNDIWFWTFCIRSSLKLRDFLCLKVKPWNKQARLVSTITCYKGQRRSSPELMMKEGPRATPDAQRAETAGH